MVQAHTCVPTLATSRPFVAHPFTCAPAVYSTQVFKGITVMLKNLPPFPVLVDYRTSSWTERVERLAIAALRYRSRVRGITIRRPYRGMVKLIRALIHPFPKLESLEICPLDTLYLNSELPILPARFRLLSGSAPCLRRLTSRSVGAAYATGSCTKILIPAIINLIGAC